MECPSEDTIALFVSGDLDGDERAHLQSHLSDCDACCAEVAALVSASDATLPVLDGDTPGLDANVLAGVARVREARDLLDPGTEVGRYVIRTVVGRGGMGTVYAARDPELDRDVAIKLVRSDRGRAGFHERLLREAQAMARLRHPNVLTVYDVGTFDDGVFLAMELIDGLTLRAWWRERERPWREVVAAFVQAGRGLEAAHRAGLVHRDFKPENVLVDRDDRVLVTDFGLARTDSEVITASTPIEDPQAPLLLSLTATGLALGTPAYMPPEQHAGDKIDARADLFAFAATLFEALAGHRPFEGANVAELREAKRTGRLREPPKQSRVPAAVWRTVRRALAPDPSDRHASIGDMLGELDRALARRGRNLLAFAGVAVLAAAGAFTLSRAAQDSDRGPRCDRAVAILAETWNPERAAAVAGAFAASGVEYAADVGGRVVASLDAYADRWARAHTDACEATHVRGEQSAHVLDLRMQCLTDRRRELARTVDVLARADADVVEHAVDVVAELRGVETCEDPRWLEGREPLPEDPTARARIEALFDRVHEARMTYTLGDVEEAGRIIAEVLPETAGLYAPLEAEALLVHGAVIQYSDRVAGAAAFFDAIVAAERGRDERTLVIAQITLAGTKRGMPLQRPDALRWLELAETRLQRLGGDRALEIQLLLGRGYALAFSRRYDEAMAAARQCLALAEGVELELISKQHVAYCHAVLGISFAETNRDDEAIREFERALADHIETFGEYHKDTFSLRQSLARAYEFAGRFEDALRLQRETLAMADVFLKGGVRLVQHLHAYAIYLQEFERYGEVIQIATRARELEEQAIRDNRVDPGRDDLSRILQRLALASSALGRHDEALAYARRAIEEKQRTVAPDNRDFHYVYTTLGRVLERAGRDREAADAYQRAVEVRANFTAVGGLGRIARRRGRLDEALELHETGLASREKSLTAGDVRISKGLNDLAETVLATGDTARARDLFERSLALFEAADTEVFPSSRVHALIGVARTIDDPVRADKLATEARDRYQRLEGPDPEVGEHIRRFFAQRR